MGKRGRRKGREGHAPPVEKAATRRSRIAGQSVLDAALPVLQDPEAVKRQFWLHVEYEMYLDATITDRAPPSTPGPPVYEMFLGRGPAYFEFYRHHAVAYVADAVGVAPWGRLLMSAMRRLELLDAEAYAGLVELLRQADGRYQQQRRSANREMQALPVRRTVEDDIHWMLRSYAAVYEIDLPLWFLGVVGRGIKTGKIDLGFLGGPDTATAQRSLLRSLDEELAGTPLLACLHSAYDADLRNAALHQDVEVVTEGDKVRVVDGRTGSEWSHSDVQEIFVASQHMQHAVVLAAQSAIARAITPKDEVSEVGVVSITSVIAGERATPLFIICQLWCFRDLDPSGSWIDRSTLTLSNNPEPSISLSPTATLTGPRVTDGMLSQVSAHGWVRIVRVPVAPRLGNGFPSLRSQEGDDYEVVGPSDEHLVPARVEGARLGPATNSAASS